MRGGQLAPRDDARFAPGPRDAATCPAHPRAPGVGYAPDMGESPSTPPAPLADVAQTAAAPAPMDSAPGDYLLCIDGERAWTFALPRDGEVVVGRGPEATLHLDDALVSRAHAQFLIVPDGIRLVDLGS